jgi:Flp pilus assembly protein CpaB
MTYRIRNIGIAIALALTAALMTTFYVSNYKRNVQQGEANVKVWVAARDIPSGTTGAAVVKQNLLQQQDVARRTVVPGAISQPDQISRLVATQRVYAGEQVTLRRFGAATERGLRGKLTGTMRAIRIPGDSNQLLSGMLRPGDHVDVVANLTVGQSDHATRIVLRDVEVLEAPQAPKVDERVNGAVDSALLAVRDTQVQRLFFVMKNADWSLELRPTTNVSDSKRDVIETTSSVLSAGARR